MHCRADAAAHAPDPAWGTPASRDDMAEVLSVLGEIRLILEEIRTLIQDTRKG
jgi:hypothetical protein